MITQLLSIENPAGFVTALVFIVITHWLGAITAFGSTLLALPVLIWFVDIETAVTVLLIVGTIQAYQVLFYTYRHVDWRQFVQMVLFAGIGVPIGIAAAAYLPRDILVAALGVVLVISGVSRLFSSDRQRKMRYRMLFLRGLLFIGGIIHGAFACGGATLVIYAQNVFPIKNVFRATLSLFWVVMNTLLIINMFNRISFPGASTKLMIAAVPSVIIASWLANRTARRISQKAFSVLVSILLVVAGVITIMRSLA